MEESNAIVTPDLMQFDSLENLSYPTQSSNAVMTRISSANLLNGSVNSPPSNYDKNDTLGYPISEQVDGRLSRYSYDVATKCRSPNCSFFGSPKNGYCSKCAEQLESHIKQNQQVQQYRKLQTEI